MSNMRDLGLLRVFKHTLAKSQMSSFALIPAYFTDVLIEGMVLLASNGHGKLQLRVVIAGHQVLI